MCRRSIALLASALLVARAVSASPDWLIDPSSFKAEVREYPSRRELVLSNGLAKRVIRLAPAAATITIEDLTTGEHLIRAVGPEARIELDGKPFPIGGLAGQPVKNYLKDEWLADLKPDPTAYRFVCWSEGPIAARFVWKRHPEWLSRDVAWPPPGRHVRMTYAPPTLGLPEIDIHYEIYDGLPLFSKWLVVRNTSEKPVHVTAFTAEELRLTEPESAVDDTPDQERPNIWVETDYAFQASNSAHAARQSVSLDVDPDYPTQVNYNRTTRCLLRAAPPIGPNHEISPGEHSSLSESSSCFPAPPTASTGAWPSDACTELSRRGRVRTR